MSPVQVREEPPRYDIIDKYAGVAQLLERILAKDEAQG